MKTLRLLIILTLMISCNKKNDDPIIVTSIDQIVGVWKWESTCGGFTNTCGYSSSSHYAQIEFAADAQFIETHNDTVYFAAHYVIQKSDDNYGTLNLYKTGSGDILSKGSISIVANKLQISFGGELYDTYKKIK
jgi:hypothetical protein